MERDRNLLFGIFAAQIKGVTPKQIVEAGAAWVVDPSIPLSRRLVDKGALGPEDVELIDRLVDAAIRAHQGDVSRALVSLGGEEQVDRVFHGSIVLRPSGGVETRAMVSDTFLGDPAALLSTIEELPGRYSHVSEFGRGGMGRVLLVHDEHMGREVALKELLLPKSEWPGPGDSPIQSSTAITARFLQEARLTGRLEHPAIVPVYELGRRQNGTLYYTMKLVRGKTLAKVLKGCRDLRERLDLLTNFVDLCQAIAYAHSRGVIHRDIKPANVMVGAFGETVVLDWGLAKAKGIDDIYAKEMESTLRNLQLKIKPKPNAQMTPFETRVGEALGTPNYMPPEQAEGRVNDITELSDVYSLGVVLYELLTGRVPFQANSVDEVLWSVIRDTPPPIASIEAGAPPELIEVCMKAIDKDPSKRYQSAAELAAEIRRFLTGSMVQAYKYTPAQVLRRYYKRHRVVLNTVAAAILALLAVGVFSYVNIWQARDREREQRLVAEEAKNAAQAAQAAESAARAEAEQLGYTSQIRLAQEFLHQHNYDQARATLWETKESSRGVEWAALVNFAYPDRFTVTTPGSTIFGAKYSPDATRIVTVSDLDPPKLYDARDGSLLLTMESTAGTVTDFAFSRDGKRLAVSDEAGHIREWDTTSGRQLLDIAAHTGMVSSITFDADGKEILSSGAEGSVRLWSTSDGSALGEINLGTAAGTAQFSPSYSLIAVEGSDGRVHVADRAQRKDTYSVPGILARFSPDGTMLATAVDKDIVLSDAKDGKEVRRLTGAPEHQGHLGSITSLHFNSKGTRLLSTSMDQSARLWDSTTGDMVGVFSESQPVLNAAFASGDAQVLTQSMGPELTLWDVESGQPLDTYHMPGNGITMFDVDSTARHMAASNSQQMFKAWDLAKQFNRTRLIAPGKSNKIDGISISSDGTLLASLGGTQATIQDATTGAAIRRYRIPASEGASVAAFSPDRASILLGLDSFSPAILNLSTDTLRSVLTGHDGIVYAATFSPDGKSVATCGWDRTARIWETDTGKERIALKGHTAPIRCVAFSANSRMVVTGSDDATICAWDIESGQLLRTYTGHKSNVFAVALSADNKRLISGSGDNTVRIWDVDTGNELRVLTNHANIVDGVAFALDDAYISTTDFNASTKIWNGATYELLLDLDNTRMAKLVDRDTLITKVIGANSVFRWDLSPRNVSNLPGDPQDSWETRFRKYRQMKIDGADNTPPTPQSSCPTVILEPARRMSALVQGLAVALEGAPSDQHGVSLEKMPSELSEQLCLPPDAYVQRVNSQNLGTSSFRPALDGAESLALSIEDSTGPRELRYVAVTESATQRTIEIKRQDLLTLLRWQIAQAERQKAEPATVAPAAPYLPDFGIKLLESNPDMPGDKLLQYGLGEQQRLLEIDAAKFTSCEQAAELLTSAATRVAESKAECTVSETLTAGHFTKRKVIYTVISGT